MAKAFAKHCPPKDGPEEELWHGPSAEEMKMAERHRKWFRKIKDSLSYRIASRNRRLVGK
jgi:hypothetical protein